MKYREFQYNMIEEFIYICFKYAMRFGFTYDSFEFKILDDTSYHSSTHFSFDKLRIKLNGSDVNFLELDIPKLLHGTFFKLKGVYYVPLIYIFDEPLTFKKESLKMYSLFKPISMYFKDNRITFDSHNIPISRFLRIYENDNNVIKEICEDIFNTQYIHESFDESIEKMAATFKCENDPNYIISYLDNIFFDDWTKELYEVYYNIQDVSIINLMDIIISRKYNNQTFEFNDLNYKRLMFIELLLDPLFKSMGSFIYKLKNNLNTNQIPIKTNAIITHFYASKESGIGSKNKSGGLSGNTVYSIVNGYSGLTSSKASFKNPKSQSDIPKSVSSIHESHKNKICPVTISNKSPGVLASLIPNQKINLRYGIFE